MAQSKFAAYYRISTARQGVSGLGLEAQREAVAQHLKAMGGKIVADFTELASGWRNGRSKLEEALRTCGPCGAKLIIAKLDRLARNVAFNSNLKESKAEFLAVDFPQANKLTVHILAAAAEHEREMICQRAEAALAAAKVRGVRLGNPHLKPETNTRIATREKIAQAAEFAARVLPVARAIGGSYHHIARELNERGVAAA